MFDAILDSIAQRIPSQGTALFLGATDVGKTTLIRALHERLGGQIIDGDVGQSWIGPPGVVSLGMPEGMQAGYFVGDISPRGNLLQVTTGIALLAQRAQRPCLIDTDGYILGEAARAYKTELINLVRPDVLVLLQRGHELDYYKLYAQKGLDVIDMEVGHRGQKRREERIWARERAFREYFRSADLKRWSMEAIRFERGLLGHGKPLDTEELSKMLGCQVRAAWKMGDEATLIVEGYAYSLGTLKVSLGLEQINLYNWSELEDLLVGCLLDGEFVGLGLLKYITPESVTLRTPVREADVLQLGSLRVGEDGRHERVRFL